MAEKLGNGGNGPEPFDPNNGQYIAAQTASNLFGVKDPNYATISTTPSPIKQVTANDIQDYHKQNPNVPKDFLTEAYRQIQRYEAIEPTITKEIVGLADKYGGVPSGLDFRMKTLKSTLDRMNKGAAGRSNPDAKKAIYGVKDALRYTLCFKDSEFENKVGNVVSDLTNKYHLGRTLNTMHPGSLYKGINCLFTDGKGMVFELQFHTPESLKAKDGFIVDVDKKTIMKDKSLKTSHEYYETARDVKTRAKNGTATQQEIADSKANNAKLYDLWKNVPDHASFNIWKYAKK